MVPAADVIAWLGSISLIATTHSLTPTLVPSSVIREVAGEIDHAMRYALITAVSFLVSACVPHVNHGPRVNPGTRYFVNAAVTHAAELQNENISVLPSVFFGGSRGWVGKDGAALSVGAQVPLLMLPGVLERDALQSLLTTSSLDVYGQLQQAAPGGIDYGAGALVSTGFVMPCFQVGRAGDDGFHTTQGLAVTYGDLKRSYYWTPSFSLRAERPDGRRGVDVYLSAGMGFGNESQDRFFTAGVVADFGPRR